MFKAGDKVKCIRAENSNYLKLGSIYTVEKDSNNLIDIWIDDELVMSFFKDRFESVELERKKQKYAKEHILVDSLNDEYVIEGFKSGIIYACNILDIPIRVETTTKYVLDR